MKIKLFLLSIVLLMATQAFAQTSHREAYQSAEVPVWLTSGSGLNVVHCFDQGASPLPYVGIGVGLHAGVDVAFDESYVSFNLRGLGNIAVSGALSQAYDFGVELGAEYLYRFFDSGDWHLWVGGAMKDYISFNYSPQLMNAALGYSSFLTWNAEGMAQYDFAKDKETSHHWCTAFAKLSLPAFGAVGRPGFAYIDNYTETLIDTDTETVTRESFMMLVPGVGTDIGLFINLLNNNKIGFSYRWDYLTTRHQDIYRFDHAIHSLNLTYMFNVN